MTKARKNDTVRRDKWVCRESRRLGRRGYSKWCRGRWREDALPPKEMILVCTHRARPTVPGAMHNAQRGTGPLSITAAPSSPVCAARLKPRTFQQPRVRAAGAVPPPRRDGRGRTDTQAPHGRGSARLQGQTDVLLPDFPARRGFTGFTLRFQAGQAHRPAQAGARLTDRRPGVRTPGRDTPPPGAMRNLRVPENAHSGDW